MRSAEGGARRDGGVGLLLLESVCVVRYTTLVLVDSTCTAAVCMVNGKKG